MKHERQHHENEVRRNNRVILKIQRHVPFLDMSRAISTQSNVVQKAKHIYNIKYKNVKIQVVEKYSLLSRSKFKCAQVNFTTMLKKLLIYL